MLVLTLSNRGQLRPEWRRRRRRRRRRQLEQLQLRPTVERLRMWLQLP
jgi:hypothetical protein